MLCNKAWGYPMGYDGVNRHDCPTEGPGYLGDNDSKNKVEPKDSALDD